MQNWIRIWNQRDISEIQKHLLIVGDLMGDCANCKEIGIDYKTATECPKCKQQFKYFTSRRFETHRGERFQLIKRLHQVRNDITWIDYEDFKKITGQQKARDIFSS